MLLKRNNAFFSYYLKPYKYEFDETITNINLKRSQVLTIVLFIVNALLLVLDLLIYKPMRSVVPAYSYLYYSHLIVMPFLMVFLGLGIFIKKQNNTLCKKVFIYSLIFTTLIWCSFIGINSIYITGGISAYIICIFSFATCFLIHPLKTLFIYSISLVFFIYGLILSVDTVQVLYSTMVNVLITAILAQIISSLNYASYCKDFLNKKRILESKQMLETVNTKLQEYEKTRTDFFANISHELRTPLNVIYTAEQMLDNSMKSTNLDRSQINKYFKMIKQNTYRLLRLINNLIDITKIDGASFKIKMINYDIVKAVEDISISVAEFIEHNGITLTFDTEIEEKIIACDPDSIERIILNLLANAVKYGKESGSIFVDIFLEENYVCISVKDTGIGIPEDMCNLIFDRFTQVDTSLKRTNEGSGIGLALVKSLVEMHGGNISVKSKFGEGSEFIIRLPDLMIPESDEQISSMILDEKNINRINIEFSDIYL